MGDSTKLPITDLLENNTTDGSTAKSSLKKRSDSFNNRR